MLKLVKLVQTCTACPSQWDAWDEDGNYVYIRYRHGHLSVESHTDKAGFYTHGGPWTDYAIFEAYVGDGLDGYMETEEMLKLIGAEFEVEAEAEAESSHSEPEGLEDV